MNTSTPASYVPLQVPQIETQRYVLVSESGVVALSTDFLQLSTHEGAKIGEINSFLSLKMYGVKDSSIDFEDINSMLLKIHRDNVIQGFDSLFKNKQYLQQTLYLQG